MRKCFSLQTALRLSLCACSFSIFGIRTCGIFCINPFGLRILFLSRKEICNKTGKTGVVENGGFGAKN